MSRQARKPTTLDEMADYIFLNGGPDKDRRAHPEKRKVRFEDLQEALIRLRKESPAFDRLGPHHFAEVVGIWADEPYEHARPLTGELVATLQAGRGWSLADVVENIEERIVCTAGFMVQRQETAATASMWPRPGLVQGAWFYRGYTQMDDQQHVLSGLLSAIPVIEEAG